MGGAFGNGEGVGAGGDVGGGGGVCGDEGGGGESEEDEGEGGCQGKAHGCVGGVRWL